MTAITFKTKIRTAYNMDDTPAYDYLTVPVFTRAHCDMAAFRSHPKWGGLANSDLFSNVLRRIRQDVLQRSDVLRLDRLPPNVTVEPGFLATVTIEVP